MHFYGTRWGMNLNKQLIKNVKNANNKVSTNKYKIVFKKSLAFAIIIMKKIYR